MVSRKKKKGKDRKAKKTQDYELYSKIAQRLWLGWTAGEGGFLEMATDIECDHGCGCDYTITPKQFAEHQRVVIPEPVDNFMTAYFFNVDFRGFNNQLESLVLFQSNRDVFVSDHYRNMAANILTRIGTNMMLREDHEDLSHAVGILELLWFLNIMTVLMILRRPSKIVLLPQRSEIYYGKGAVAVVVSHVIYSSFSVKE